MTKDLLDLLKELFNERNRQREKFVVLLDQMAAEMDQLAAFWTEITARVCDGTGPAPEIESLRFKQRERFAALVEFESWLSSYRGRYDTCATSTWFCVQNAVGIKSRLYGLAEAIQDADYPLTEKEAAALADSLAPGTRARWADRRRIRLAMGADESAKESYLTPKKIEMKKLTGDLCGFAGKLRAVIAVFKAEVPFA